MFSKDPQVRATATIPIFFCIALVSWTFYTYNFTFLQEILPSEGKDLSMTIFFAVVFNFFWVQMVWSYFRTALTHPGSPPYDEWLKIASGLPVHDSDQAWQPGQITMCKKCDKVRPERAHHCSRCKICVLRMDHHCPWTGNCVGFVNHKFFLLLGFYVFLMCTFCALTMLPEFWRSMQCTWTGASWKYGVWQSGAGTNFFFFWISDAGVAALMGSMLHAHVPLAMSNMTTIEETYENANPYDLQQKLENFQQIMGAVGLDWFFPVMPVSPLTDGVSFAKTDERPRLDDEELEPEEIWRVRYSGENLLLSQY